MSERQIRAYLLPDGEKLVKVIGQTDECPLCHRKIIPKEIYVAIKADHPGWVQIAYRCTNRECQKLFVGTYESDILVKHPYGYRFSYPYKSKLEEFSEEIKKTSKMFMEIYNQALIAERQKLEQMTTFLFTGAANEMGKEENCS